jgi:hypothetical protein
MLSPAAPGTSMGAKNMLQCPANHIVNKQYHTTLVRYAGADKPPVDHQQSTGYV